MKITYKKDKYLIEITPNQLLTIRSTLDTGVEQLNSRASIAKALKQDAKYVKYCYRLAKDAKKVSESLEEATQKAVYK